MLGILLSVVARSSGGIWHDRENLIRGNKLVTEELSAGVGLILGLLLDCTVVCASGDGEGVS